MATLIVKPCPYCGADASVEEIPACVGDVVSFSVGCDSGEEAACMGYQSLTQFPTRKAAIEAWNRRAPSPDAIKVEAAGWQPIETAPKDGTPLLLACAFAGKHLRYVGRWGEYGWMRDETTQLYFPDYMQEWFVSWMPLPQTPALSAFEQEGRS